MKKVIEYDFVWCPDCKIDFCNCDTPNICPVCKKESDQFEYNFIK